MKKNRQFLLALVIMILPCCFLACSDKSDGTPDEPVATAVAFNMPDFTDSYVYVVMKGDQKVAEICSEYIPAFSIDKRATVVYPFDQSGKVDHTKGIVTDNGGSVSWNGTACTYKAGTGALKTLYAESNQITTATASLFETVVATPDKLKDADGSQYKIVKIGSQYWLGENMKTTKLKNGNAIPTNLTPAEWCAAEKGAYLIYKPFLMEGDVLPDDLSPEKIKANYGLLYSWEAAKNIAPAGWHLPSATEWEALRTYLGDTEESENPVAGGMLKEVGLTHWQSATTWEGDNEIQLGNVGATNVTGFTAVGSGFVFSVAPDMEEISCGSIKTEAAWFSSSEKDEMVIYFGASNSSASLSYNDYGSALGAMSVRLIRD